MKIVDKRRFFQLGVWRVISSAAIFSILEFNKLRWQKAPENSHALLIAVIVLVIVVHVIVSIRQGWIER